MSSLTQASLRGIRWSALSQLLAQTAQYGSFILLARLLTPAEFGTVASATLVIGLVAPSSRAATSTRVSGSTRRRACSSGCS